MNEKHIPWWNLWGCGRSDSANTITYHQTIYLPVTRTISNIYILVFVVIRTKEYDLIRNLQCSLKRLFGFSEINIRLHRFFVAWPVWTGSFSQVIHINQISKPTCFNQIKQILSQVQIQLCIDRRVQYSRSRFGNPSSYTKKAEAITL